MRGLIQMPARVVGPSHTAKRFAASADSGFSHNSQREPSVIYSIAAIRAGLMPVSGSFFQVRLFPLLGTHEGDFPPSIIFSYRRSLLR